MYRKSRIKSISRNKPHFDQIQYLAKSWFFSCGKKGSEYQYPKNTSKLIQHRGIVKFRVEASEAPLEKIAEEDFQDEHRK